jgi:tetratricopeptide (TPR) repeat protein
VEEPGLGVKRLIARVQEALPGARVGSKEVREALRALDAVCVPAVEELVSPAAELGETSTAAADEVQVHECGNCGAVGEHIVSKCERCVKRNLPPVFYCNTTCQAEHWETHKEFHKAQKRQSVDQEGIDKFPDQIFGGVLDSSEPLEVRQEYADLCGKATVAVEAKNYRRAEKKCLEAIELVPSLPQAYGLLGGVYERANQREKALPLVLQALECYEASSREKPEHAWWSDLNAGLQLWNALNLIDKLPDVTPPTWWTDAELLERSAKAFGSLPQAFSKAEAPTLAGVQALRGRVLSGVHLGAWEGGLRSVADMREGANCLRRTHALAHQFGESEPICAQFREFDKLAQHVEGAIERIEAANGVGGRWKASGGMWQLQVGVVKHLDEVPDGTTIASAADPGFCRLSKQPQPPRSSETDPGVGVGEPAASRIERSTSSCVVVPDKRRTHGVRLVRTPHEERGLTQHLCRVAVDVANGSESTSLLFGILGDDSNISEAAATAAVRTYLDHGGQVDASLDTTLLKIAAMSGRAGICNLLLQQGANANLVLEGDSEQGSPLMAAAIDGHASVIRVLLEGKADPSLRDFEGRTALELAERNESPSILEQMDDSERNEALLRQERKPAAAALLRQHATAQAAAAGKQHLRGDDVVLALEESTSRWRN